MKACLQYAPMIGSRDGELTVEEARALAAHLEGCASCRALADRVAATEGLLAEALLAKANSRDFGPFVDQVMARVERGPGSASAWLERLSSRMRTVRARWVLAGAAAALAVLATVAAFRYVQKDSSEPEELAVLEMDVQGGSTVLQTSDGPVVLLEPDDSGS